MVAQAKNVDSRVPRITLDNPFFASVGNTPLIKVSEKIYAKLETFNPTGSIKDRMIKAILREAILKGEINEDTILVEATSGNTGIALSGAGAALGLPVEIFMPKNMSEARKQMMTLFGAELHLTGPNDFLGAIAGRDEKVANDKRYWSPNQFANRANRLGHLATTCGEVDNQLAAIAPNTKWEAFVHGSGTGGTISAFVEYKKAQGLDYKVVMTEPSETPETHGIQGIYDGADFLMNRENIDFTWKIPTQEAIERAKRFAKEFGILIGVSSGANLALAEKYVEEMKPEGAVVTIFADRGERYIDTLSQ